MLTHPRIWAALDRLAEASELSVSGLARKAGLDPTAFNKSKRVAPDGRPRWPSTESIAKVLDATGTSMAGFLDLAESGGRQPRPVPLIGMAQAGQGGFFTDAGFPVGSGWDEVGITDFNGEHAYALEISGDSMLPVYRDGDRVIVSPTEQPRRGDRVVVKTTDGEVLAKELKRKTAKFVELRSLNPEHEDRVIPIQNVAWIARIVWASQ